MPALHRTSTDKHLTPISVRTQEVAASCPWMDEATKPSEATSSCSSQQRLYLGRASSHRKCLSLVCASQRRYSHGFNRGCRSSLIKDCPSVRKIHMRPRSHFLGKAIHTLLERSGSATSNTAALHLKISRYLQPPAPQTSDTRAELPLVCIPD